MVKIVNGEVVDENAPPPPPSLASFGALSQRTLGGLSHYTIGGWLLLACVSFVLAGFRGIIAVLGFIAAGRVILHPPSGLPSLPGLPASLSSLSSGGGGGGGGGGPGRPTGGRPNIRGVGDLPARPRG